MQPGGMRQGVRSIARAPSWVYQRYSQIWRRALLAAGWALLYVLVDASVAGYEGLAGTPFPIQWRVVLAACIFIGGLWKPVVAYAIFSAAVAYPLYLISIYIMALAVAVLLLSAPLTVRYLPLALAIVGMPVLAPLHLTPVVPLLVGLWSSELSLGGWGTVGSIVAGGLCALWLKICAGMASYSLDLWHINGWTMKVGPIYERFHAANSLETLIRLVEPLSISPESSSSTALLFHLLQVLAWVGAAYVTGVIRNVLLVRKMGRAGRGSVWTTMLSLVPGVVVIWAGYVIVPTWLKMPGLRWYDPLWLPAQVVLAGSVALGIDGLMRYLQQPLYARARSVRVAVPSAVPWWKRKKRSTPQVDAIKTAIQKSEKDVRSSAHREGAQSTDRTDSERSRPEQRANDGGRRDAGDDIIMIELD